MSGVAAQEDLIVARARLTDRGNIDGRAIIDRTGEFTCPAPGTELGVHIGSLQDNFFSVAADYSLFFEKD
jgi:hypothetical protein